jgi:hypothetical protein
MPALRYGSATSTVADVAGEVFVKEVLPLFILALFITLYVVYGIYRCGLE